MDTQKLTEFFKWCSIINGTLLVLTILLLTIAPDFVYATQSSFFPIEREAYDVAMYSFVGLYKIAFIVFSIVPYLALRIIGK